MEPKPVTPFSESRRIFITENTEDFFQLFSFAQNEKDGTIYVSWPTIDTTKWLLADNHFDPKAVYFADSPGEGKISFHGTGEVHFKTHSDTRTRHFRIDGNILKKESEGHIGARHLLTIFITKPEFQPPNSPAFNRKSDFSLHAKKIQPAIFVLMAIPKQGKELQLNFSLRISDMENIPGDVLGFGTIPMQIHDVLWIAYRTKHLDNWPKHNHVMYTDGFLVPLFIGQENNQLHTELVKPEYRLTDKLEIHISALEE